MAKDKSNQVTIPSEAPALPSMTDGLARYLAEIKRFPLLEPDEEYMLAKRWQEHQDPKAAE